MRLKNARKELTMPIYDSLGLPRDVGATNLLDSARMAGMCVISGFNYHIDLSMYVYSYSISKPTFTLRYTRHPLSDPDKMPFSRDQTSCLFAGLYYQGKIHLVNPNYQPPNGDIISPSVRGHFKRCAGFKANALENMWLWIDVIYSAFIDPLAEPNQLIAMLLVADFKYLRAWKRWNKSWERSVTKYWSQEDGAWRGEPELAQALIKTIEERK